MAHNDIRLPAKWIELNLTKKECSSFIASVEDDSMCQCGRRKIDHGEYAKHIHRPDIWNPSLHTRSFPTDAYGTVIFEGEHHPNKAHYVRLSYDTNPELVIQLMTLVWGLEMPKLVISIRGGNTNFELPPRLGKILQLGLIKAAKSTGAWIFTGGLNDGVTRHIGQVMSRERAIGLRRGRVVTVGIAPWGMVEHRNELISRNKDRIYSPLEHALSKCELLNPRHTNFLLVDNGSVGKVGGESYFRRRLEKCISSYPTSPHRGCDIPIICIVIEGGFYTLRNIGDYLHEDPPVPVVIFGGSGRTADLVAWVLRRLLIEGNLDSFKDEILSYIMKIYHVNESQSGVLYSEVKRIVAKKSLITVFNVHANNEEDFDAVILTSIFRSQHWSPLQQLSLSLVWDRVDIATNEVFVYGREWSKEHLEHAMMEALVSDRLDFVNLLLEHGLNMQAFLTASRLETLYSVEKNHSSLLRMLVFDLAKVKSNRKSRKKKGKNTEKKLTLHDIGIAFSQMMGHIYKSNYIHILSKGSKTSMGYGDDHDIKFFYPFDDLFVWSILTKRHKMALLLWRHGQGALAKALVAVKLNSYISQELMVTEKTETSLAVEFRNYANEWETISLELVDNCFLQDQKRARQLLTMELERWSNMTCLTLAVMANHRMLLGHPCCQMLLADLWMGALNIKNHSTLKVIFGIIFPPSVFFLDFKSTEELKLLPHQDRQSFEYTIGSDKKQSNQWLENGISETASLRTYGSKSQSSFGNFFRKNLGVSSLTGNNRERQVNLEEVVKKLNAESESTASPIISSQQDDNIGSPLVGSPNTKADHYKMPHPHQEHHHHHQHHHHQHVTIVEPEKPLFPSEDSIMQNPSFFALDRRQQNSNDRRSSFVTTRQTLRKWSKFIEFQRAPITNFYRHAIAYLIFVGALSYVILVPQDKEVAGVTEIYVIAYLITLGSEVFRQYLSIDAVNGSQKWVEFRTHVWQISDFCGVCFFMVGVGLRFRGHFDYGMLLYRVSSIYWNLRLYKYMGVHRFVGPKIVMMSRMLKHMAYFAMIILVVIIAFGMAREAIRFPDTYPTWRNIAEAFLEPYVMMFGEVDTDALSPQCGEKDQPACPVGYWIIPLTWTVYMMVANILIVNVLIAVFNGIYSEIDAIAVEVWMFQRFTFVMEFEEKPLLPPPAIIICHSLQILTWMYQKTKLCLCEQELEVQLDDDEGPRIIVGNDHRLKTFLSPAEANIVFDFEEDNLEFLSVSVPRNNQSGAVYDYDGITDTSMLSRKRSDLGLAVGIVPVGGVTESSKDRQGIQQLKVSFREMCSELETHRTKLDKLLSYWEMETENRDSEESVLEEETSSHLVPADFSGLSADNKTSQSGPNDWKN